LRLLHFGIKASHAVLSQMNKSTPVPLGDKCYQCDSTATSIDHVPPRCFFPEPKHAGDLCDNVRSGLLTVPACSTHNNKRSKDDEYTAAMIAMNCASPLAQSMFDLKWMRALTRREGSLGKRIFGKSKRVNVHTRKTGIHQIHETLAVRYEIDRVNRVIESIARGLFVLENDNKYKWTGECIVRSPGMLLPDLKIPSDAEQLKHIDSIFEKLEINEDVGLKRKGHCPEVFFWQAHRLTAGMHIFRLVFFEEMKFLAILH